METYAVRANPNQKAADLISFDAFADEEQGMSGDGGLSLPTAGGTQNNNSSMAAGGLPLDLFSSPSPAPTSDLSSLFASSSSTQAPKQDPMAFFNTSSAPLQPIHQQQIQPQRSQSPYGMPAQQPSSGMSGFGFGTGIAGQQQHQLRSGTPTSAGFAPMQPQQPAQGYSVPSQNGQGGPMAGGQAQTQGQPKKKDAFADLVDLMN
jgi:ADP-ribosylation factor-binding protein GGA